MPAIKKNLNGLVGAFTAPVAYEARAGWVAPWWPMSCKKVVRTAHLRTNSRLRMVAGRVRRAHQSFLPLGSRPRSDIRGRGNQTVIFARNEVFSFVQCKKGSRHGADGLEPLPCRKRGNRNATTFEIPVGPGSGIENTGRGTLQNLAKFFQPGHTLDSFQVFDRAIGHQVRQKMHRLGQRLLRLFEPDDPAGDVQEIRGHGQRLHGVRLPPSGRCRMAVNEGRSRAGSTAATAASRRWRTSGGSFGTSSK